MSQPIRRLPMYVLVALLLWSLLPSGLALAASSSVEVVLSTTTPVVNSGDWAVVKVSYSCASIISVPCQDVVISSVIPPELARGISDVQVLDPSGDTTVAYDPATATATWSFNQDLSAGSAGSFTLMVRFQRGSTPDGAIANLRAEISGVNAPPMISRPLPLTASAQPDARARKRFLSGGVLDLPTVYRVEVCVPTASGTVDLTSVVMTDTLPTDAVLVDADGGNYDPGTNTITWPAADILVSAGETCLRHDVTVRFPSGTFQIGDEIRNELAADVIALNGATMHLTGVDVRLIQPPTPNPGFGKSGPSSAEVGDSISYSFRSTNDGTSPLDAGHTFTDNIPAELEVSRISAAAHNQATTIRLQIDYQTNLDPTWTGVPGAPFSGAACVDVNTSTGCATAISLSPGERISALRYTYLDALPYGFAVNGNGFSATVTSVPTNQIIVNTADAEFSYNGHTILEQSTVQTRVIEHTPGARPTLVKGVDPGIVNADDTVTYTLTLTNTAFRSLSTPLQNPQIADLLVADLLYLDGSQQVMAKPVGAPDPIFELVPNYKDSGRMLLRWRWPGYSLAVDDSITIAFQARIAPYTPSGTLSNTGYLSGWDNQPDDIVLDSCSSSSADSYDFDNDGNTQEQICSSTISSVTLAAAAKSDSLKLVRGQLDTAWTKDPNHGYTVPGGSANYQLVITNTGTIPISELTLLDILPWVGDVGVKRFVDARETEWRPYLAAPIGVPPGASIFYSTQNNPCRAPDLGLDPANDSPGCSAPAWSSAPPADITTVQSFKIEFGSLVLQPGEAVVTTVYLRAPYADSVTAGEVAWNSFGYRARAVGDPDYLPAPEPPRVGIERENAYPPAYGNYVWHDQNSDGLQTSGEPGVNGVQVQLFRDSDGVSGPSAGDFLVDTTITGPDDAGSPGYYLFSSFPLPDARHLTVMPPGDYYARFTPPVGYGVTAQNIGANDTLDSDVDQATRYTPVTSLSAGEIDITWDLGLTSSTAVGNYVWIDRNGNGLQDEPPGDGVNGVRVNLRRATDDSLVATTLTADDPLGLPGYYLFDKLSPGGYYVEFIRPSGFGLTGQDGGDDSQDSDADPATGRTASFSLAANQLDLSRDAGLTLPAGALTLGNLVWRDLNNDGIYGPAAGEPGIDGVALSLYRDANSNGLADNGENVANTVTTSHLGQPGWYQFSNLTAGNYIVAIDADNFAPGGALFGLRSSSGNQPTPDPDTVEPNEAIDDDDNGDPAGGRIVSQAITLSNGGEPGAAVDGDGGNGNQTLDFGLIGGASLGNFVWFDTNGDGRQDASEPGVPGVTVELLDSGNTVLRSTTTDSAGHYGFGELSAGDYRLRFGNLPAGHSFTSQDSGAGDALDSDADPASGETAAISLLDGQDDLSWDAGLVAALASIGDRAWDDLDRDGVQDPGEPGINGVTVELYRADGSLVATTASANVAGSDGIYSFSDLPPGDYYLIFRDLPSGYTTSPVNIGGDDAQDSDADRLSGRTATTTLAPGENDPSWDIGIFSYASIGDYVWVDLDRDGVQDAGENGRSGVAVRLYRPGSSTPLATTTTDDDGRYRFTDLAPGDYYLEFSMPAGFRSRVRDAGGNTPAADLLDSDPDLSTYQTILTTLDPGEDDTSWDFGIYPTASIGDWAWLDRNANGLQDDGSAAVPGVQVVLHDGGGSEIDSTVTDATGYYRFSGLEPGDYSLSFLLPPTYLLSPQNVGANDSVDSDVNGLGQTASFNLPTGATDLSWDLGLYQESKLGDRVWHDQNANGVQDSGEPGIPGVTVTLYDGSNVQVGAPVVSDANGNYLFSGLQPGSYAVAFAMPSGYTQVSPQNSAAADSETNSDVDPATLRTAPITLDSSSTDLSWDMGVYNPAALGNYVWLDSDVDGLQDPGEAGVNGVTVTLYRSDASPVATTTTANDGTNDGAYRFDGLTPGNYYVIFSNLPADHAFTRRDQGSDNGLDSDVNPLSGQTGLIGLASGQTDLTWDAGIYPTIDVGDRVWLDENANGIQDPAETTGIAGVRVSLYNGAGLVDYTYTNLDGNYLFTDLFPDTYHIVFGDIPAGYARSAQDRGGDDAQDSDADGSFTTDSFTLAASDLTRDLGLYQPASLGDFVWFDRNANGLQEAGEPGIAGATVNLSGSDGAGTPVSLSTTTDANGAYSFANLAPGNYQVTFSMPAGFDRASPANQGGNDAQDSDADPNTGQTSPIELVSGENDPDWDAGFYQLVRLGNLVWEDVNNNGQLDGGESGIAGVSVNITGTDGAGTPVSLSTTTDGSGFYLFDNLVPGDYVVELPASNFSGAGALAASGSLPAYRSSTGTNGSASGPYEGAALADPDGNIDSDDSGSTDGSGNVRSLPVTLRSRDEPPAGSDSDDTNGNLTLDFGVFRPLSLGNLVWNDLNDNQLFESATESGIDGVTVELYRDSDGNSSYSAGTDQLVATTPTAGGGLYLFENLSPGDYVVVIPAGNFVGGAALQYFRSSDGGLAADSAIDPDTGDLNDDDNGVGPSGGVVAGLVSSGAVTLSLGGEPTGDGDGSSNSNLSVDFGFYSLGVGNLVFQDRDNNGLFDGSDSGINGRTVSLYYDADGSGTLAGSETTAVATLSTSNGGRYFFGGLRSGGQYQIGVATGGAGWVSSTAGANGAASGPYEPGAAVNGNSSDGDDNGTQQPTGNTARSAFFTVAADGEPAGEADTTMPNGVSNPAADSSSNLTIDFGLFNHARMGDKVWIDSDGDGVQDTGETTGVGGVTVRLYDSTNTLIASRTTNASGIYGFNYLLPGSYYVTFDLSTIPAAYAVSPQNAGGTAATNSDADPASGQAASFSLAANNNDQNWDMGLYPRLSLGNLVWDDHNDNGLVDGGEPGIDGVTVELYRDSNSNGGYDAGVDQYVATQTTSGGGGYLFSGLTQGDYLVIVPAGNFASGQPLFRYRSSTGANGAASGPYEPAPDPDTNSDNDDNGTDLADVTVMAAVSLNPSFEPAAAVDTDDSNGNLTLDLGFFQHLSLGNLVWEDTNNNGLFDSATESGIPGATVQLYGDNNGNGSYDAGTDTFIAGTSTDGSGLYRFEDLIPGDYLVVLPAAQFGVGQPLAGYRSSTGSTGSTTGTYEPAGDPDDDSDDRDDGSLSGGDVVALAIRLDTGSEPDSAADGDSSNGNQTVDFGLFRPASLGDRVWHDQNANGVQDPGEPGIAGVSVILFDSADATVASTTTDGSGNYSFNYLIPGDYYVVFGTTAGYSHISVPNVATATSATDSDAHPLSRDTPITSLSAGQNDPTWDLGVYNLASLGDTVWEDLNGNGVQDDGATGVGGVTVTLSGTNSVGGTISLSTTTDSNGNYGFDNLMPGSYQVTFTAPAGYQITLRDNASGATANQDDSDADRTTGQTIITTLVSGENDPSWDAGLYRPASLGDRIWEDRNGDGAQDGGEPGVAGRTITLRWAGPDGTLDTGDDTTATTTSDGSGGYGFSNLIPGTYRVEFGANPAGFVYTTRGGGSATDSDADPANGRTGGISLASGQGDPDWDAGIYRLLSLGNLVWEDLNNNGRFDSATESGIPGVIVELYVDSDGSGDYSAGDSPAGSTTTDGSGIYGFADLAPGDYLVVIPASNFAGPLSGFISSSGSNGSAGGAYEPADDPDNDSDNRDDGSLSGAIVAAQAITLSLYGEPAAGVDGDDSSGNQSVDFGFFRPARIGDRVWEDRNGDGVQDGGEPGVDGVTVTLYDATSAQVASTTTSGGGLYGFDSLIQGDYTIVFSNLPSGYTFSPQGQGTAAGGSDADPANGSTTTITLATGQSDLDWDAGIYRLLSLGNLVWEDLNNNGRFDSASESGIPGVTVELYVDSDGSGDYSAGDSPAGSTTTDASGIYQFGGLTQGAYVVVIPAGNFSGPLRDYLSSTAARSLTAGPREPAPGPNDDSDNDDDGSLSGGQVLATAVQLSAAGEPDSAVDGDDTSGNQTIDFGFFRPASIGDQIWEDSDGDGLQNSGEPGMPGVTVTLYEAAGGTQVRSTTTDSNGEYRFSNLPPGSYYLEFALPADYFFTRRNAGGDPTADSDPDRSSGQTGATDLSSGENDLDWDAGINQLVGLGDTVWEDLNRNGVQDAGEPGVAGVTVTLYEAATNTQVGLAQTTDGDGFYQFVNLAPGRYYLIFDNLPAGYFFSDAGQGGDSSTDSDADPASGRSADIDLLSNQDDPTWDAGIYRLASVGDRVWDDLDGDGVQEAGEAGVAGVSVALYEAGSGLLAGSTTTDGSGSYQFSGLLPGSYYLTFDNLPAGYIFSPAGRGGDGKADSDAARASGQSSSFSLASGQDDPTWDAGIYLPAGLGDRIWDDANANGLQDSGESGVAGVTVQLIQAGSVISSTVTASDGSYQFRELGSGDYQVRLIRPSGRQISPALQGGDPTRDSDIDRASAQSGTASLTPGALDNSLDGGLYQLASVGNKVWEDSNRNGILDAGEPGIAGVTVELYRSDGTLVASAVTDNSGTFIFSELEPGDYYIQFAAPAGWSISPPDQGGDNNIDSDATPSDGKTKVFSLGIGTLDLTWWAGMSRPPTAITLLSFTQERQSSGNLLRWQTGSELNSAGFVIYRSATGKRADAQQVSGSMLLARGVGGGGASYSWLDRSADAQLSYSYWLVEIEIGGARHEYPLAQPTLGQVVQLYLPLVIR